MAIPRISKEVFNSLKVRDLSAVEFCHFKGSSKPIPPRMNNHYGLSLDLVTKTMTSLNAALQADIAWLFQCIAEQKQIFLRQSGLVPCLVLQEKAEFSLEVPLGLCSNLGSADREKITDDGMVY